MRRGPVPEGRALVERASTGLVPLCDMTAAERYLGQEGGLYGDGDNAPPDAHRRTAEAAVARIVPRDGNGLPAADGLIGLISISMSNATQEFSTFKQLADSAPEKSHVMRVVDCAQGGQAMAEWGDPRARAWDECQRRLSAAGVGPKQVQAAWIKLANKGPRGTLEEHGRRLEKDTADVLRNAKATFPNLQVAYLSSRIYGGWSAGLLNPEPYAYEGAFVVRWLIQRQIAGDAGLACTGDSPPAPVLLWGPYLWADGTRPRRSDGLTYDREDLAADGTHPSLPGRRKVAGMLLDFFTRDPLAKPWFTGGRAAASPVRP